MLLESKSAFVHSLTGSEKRGPAVRRDVTHVVLGAGGFVGGALVERLRGAGAGVVPVIHRDGRSTAFLARFELRPQVADVRNVADLQNAFTGADTVFHCVTGDRATIVEGLSNALLAAQRAGVRRFVYLSSAAVYGFRPDRPVVETSPLNPPSSSGYAKNKAAAEEIIGRWRGGPETVVLRPSIIYGPRSKYWSEAPARELVAGVAYLVDQGCGYLNDIHISHLLDGMLLAAYHPKAANQIYVLQDGFGLTWADYYRSLCELLGVRFESVRAVSMDDVIRNASKLRGLNRWIKDTPKVLRAAVWHDPLKSWLKRAPGFETVRKFAPEPSTKLVGNGAGKTTSSIEPQLEIALLHTYPQPIDDSKIRAELGFAPRFTFAQTLEGLRRWYRFIGLMRGYPNGG